MPNQKSQAAAGASSPKKKRGRPTFKATAALRKKVKAMRKAGLTNSEAAAALGISEPTLSRHFRAELGPVAPPAFKPTPAMRRKVETAAGGGMSRRDIALGLGISVGKLTKHFRHELTAGALAKRMELLEAMYQSGMNGNVSAQRSYLRTVLASDEAVPKGKRPSSASPGSPPKGKKEQAAEDAQTAAAGSEWDDLLPPSGVTIQ